MSLRYWCFWRLSRKRQTINATTHTFLERSREDLSKNVWVVTLIVYRFRDKRQKYQHHSYRGDYNSDFFRVLTVFAFAGKLFLNSVEYLDDKTNEWTSFTCSASPTNNEEHSNNT